MRPIAKKAKVPNLPRNCEALDLSRQQKQICAMVLREHLTAKEIAKRLNTTEKAIRNQIGRIWQKAENKTNRSVNTGGRGVNYCGETVTPEALRAKFSTQVQKIVYLNAIGFKNKQIAEILQIKDSNVRQVLSRSKRQTVSRKFTEPIPINPEPRFRNPIEEAVLVDGGRMFYHKFVAGTNKAPTREVLRGLHLTGQGGRDGARIVLGDRARIIRLLAELSRCNDSRNQIIRVDEDDKIVRKACGTILSNHFTQILPGRYKPKNGLAIEMLQSTLRAAVSQGSEVAMR